MYIHNRDKKKKEYQDTGGGGRISREEDEGGELWPSMTVKNALES